ncbi:MAG: isopropylmalate/homocitrate/citramalate synthase, partial [Dokdonella sp.]|nr:isopropylmalate/homocitrate/citramalate synthase [Dokdonella sp.]
PGGAFFEIHDGRITRVSNYYNLQDWLRQVGA